MRRHDLAVCRDHNAVDIAVHGNHLKCERTRNAVAVAVEGDGLVLVDHNRRTDHAGVKSVCGQWSCCCEVLGEAVLDGEGTVYSSEFLGIVAREDFSGENRPGRDSSAVTTIDPEELGSMGKRSEVSVAERREAVLSFLRREEPGAVIARRYGVAEATLYRWRDDFLAAGEAALAGGTQSGSNTRNRQVAELERQIESRDQVIGELTVANRV